MRDSARWSQCLADRRQKRSINGCAMLLRFLIVFGVFVVISGYDIVPGPQVIATKGAAWPKPQYQEFSDKFIVVGGPNTVDYRILQEECSILKKAVERSKNTLNQAVLGQNLNIKNNKFIQLEFIDVILTEPCIDDHDWPYLNMPENYELEVSSANKSIRITSNSTWGIIHGFNTLSQLMYKEDNFDGITVINETKVVDFPRFPHRGLLLDTSRHYLPLNVILLNLNAMAYNKLNVFHWHIVDDQSFPYVSQAFPDLSLKGAYHRNMIYSPEDVQTVIQHAKSLGIRVMVEFDTPGHTRSWGEAIPKLLTTCYDGLKPNGYLGPIDPSRNSTYDFLRKFFKEVVQVFPDQYIHLGGDEVDFSCWKSNPLITKFMQNNNISDYSKLEAVYIKKLLDIVEDLKSNSIVWEEVFVNGVVLPKDTVVHVWIGNGKEVLSKVTEAGNLALLSSCWYLDNIAGGGDWQKFYTCEPHDFPGNDDQKNLVMGGEACMWGEVVDATNALSRIWPRASAVAERLWSNKNITDIKDAKQRMEENYCRMQKMDIPAQPPNGPGYCY